ncbi:MAG: ABC transporter ATP-binding protein, partial [Planctomycetia bacterium]
TSKLADSERTRMRRLDIGFVYQFHHLLPEFTALENVMLPQMIAGLAKAEAKARASELLGYLGLAERLTHRPAELSGGEQQRVAVARAIVKRPEVLLCDEPTGALDVKTGVIVLEALVRVSAEIGATTVLITHNAGIAAIADRVLQMSDGRVVGEEGRTTRAAPRDLRW